MFSRVSGTILCNWKVSALCLFTYLPILCDNISYYSKKCDNNHDCEDETDEMYCDYVVVTDTYNKDLAPRHRYNHSNPVTVYVNLLVAQIRSIDTPQLKFTTDFHLL